VAPASAGCPEGILPSAAGETPEGLPPGRRRYAKIKHTLLACAGSASFFHARLLISYPRNGNPQKSLNAERQI